MVQFYFLSIALNLAGGYALIVDSLPERSRSIEGLRDFFRDPVVRLILGILAAVTGALKFLTAMRGDIPVVGDFLPAVGGLGVGLTLLLERSQVENGRPNAFERLFLDHKPTVGLVGLVAAVVHFLFPMVIFL